MSLIQSNYLTKFESKALAVNRCRMIAIQLQQMQAPSAKPNQALHGAMLHGGMLR